MEVTNDQWIEEALKVHGIISLKIHCQLMLDLDQASNRKKMLKKALALIDELDWLLEPVDEREAKYKKNYRALFELLESLGLDLWALQTLEQSFGAKCFFVREARCES